MSHLIGTGDAFDYADPTESEATVGAEGKLGTFPPRSPWEPRPRGPGRYEEASPLLQPRRSRGQGQPEDSDSASPTKLPPD